MACGERSIHRGTQKSKMESVGYDICSLTAWLHVPENESPFQANPYPEMYLENTPRKNPVTAVCVPCAELKKIRKGEERRKKRQAQEQACAEAYTTKTLRR